MKLVVETIEEQFEKRKQFSAVELNRYVGIDSNRYLRLLGRLGFLEQGKDKVEAKVTIYSRTSAWPPPVEFFKGTPIGIVYNPQQWFRSFRIEIRSRP